MEEKRNALLISCQRSSHFVIFASHGPGYLGINRITPMAPWNAVRKNVSTISYHHENEGSVDRHVNRQHGRRFLLGLSPCRERVHAI
jgi:hypothetical protein